MDNFLQIRTGAKRVDIKDDFGDFVGTFVFYPSDIGQANKIFSLTEELEVMQQEYEQKIKDASNEKEQMTVLLDSCKYMKDKINYIFGEGSSEILFRGANTLQMFDDFFNGIIPYYKKASEEKTKKYKK